MGEGSLKASLFLLGLILSGAQSIGGKSLRDDYIYWASLGIVLFGVANLVIAPLWELIAKKRFVLILLLSLLSGLSLTLSIQFFQQSTTSNIPISNPSPTRASKFTESKVRIENSSIFIYKEDDCIMDLSINDTDFTNCSLSCPIDSLRICETFNYMILCISNGNDIHFSKELKLISLPLPKNESLCESEYRLRYANRVDMELAPGCILECNTIASWTDLVPAEKEKVLSWDLEFKIAYGAALVMLLSLILVIDGHFLVCGPFITLGDKYAYFLFGSALLPSAIPYLEHISGQATISVYSFIPLLTSIAIFLSTIFCHQRSLQQPSRPLLKSIHVWKQVTSLLKHHKLTILQITILTLCLGMESSWNISEFYSQDKLLISLHATKGTLITLPLIALMGDHLLQRFGASSCLSISLLGYGMEFIGFGTLKALPFAVLHFLLSPFAAGFGTFAILKFAQIKFAEECRLPTYGLLSCLGLPLMGKAMGVFLNDYDWIYAGSFLLLVFVVIQLSKCKWNRKKIPPSDRSEYI